ncbi:hypothetical protein GCM10009802_00110 [Streptomyces synnematoformans]|uniref:peptide-methionine (R)-S-oxide reductase n=1 Tax=Streptomyces synnematoformans TaxID=415721 RepID=A0ABN2X772_9ACTN
MAHGYGKTPEALSRLTDSQFRVTQKDGTEPAFRNEYWNNHEAGIYVDVVSASRCSRLSTSTTAAPVGRASAALRFIPLSELEAQGYGRYRSLFGTDDTSTEGRTP